MTPLFFASGMEWDVYMLRQTLVIPIVLLFSMAWFGCAGSNATDIKKARAYEDIGNSAVRQGKLRTALENYLEAEKYDPENAYIKNELAIVFRGLGENQKAFEYFKAALTLKPRFPDAQNNLCGLYLVVREWDLAIEYCQKAADDLLYKTPHFAYTQMGTAYSAKGKQEMAVQSFQQALKLAPEYSPAYLGLGYVYEKLKFWNGAIEAYQKSILYNPDNADAYFRMGKLYQRMNRAVEAQEAFKHFLELVPEGPDAEEAKKLLRTM
jgi:tetratricopeptide (TPR) repeat protein